MVLILSTNEDYTSTLVCEWLEYLGSRFYLITESDEVEVEIVSINDVVLIVNKKKKILLNEINAFWYRRGHINLFNIYSIDFLPQDLPFSKEIKFKLYRELEDLHDFILFLFETKKSLGSFKKTSLINKISVLYKAKVCGLDIPDTLITTSVDLLNRFWKQQSRLITKSISVPFGFSNDKIGMSIYTENVTEEALHNINTINFPSLFQKNIDKKFDIRIFFINDAFYSMAIFSQLDQNTSTDFRKYNLDNPNRNIPFNLPKRIEKRLKRLMKLCGYDTGSIDIILGKVTWSKKTGQ